jgi:hypothetical protein
MKSLVIILTILVVFTAIVSSLVLLIDKYTGFLDKYGIQTKKYLFLSGIMGLLYFITLKYNSSDWDLWARLAVGKIFSQIGNVLPKDIFAYTPTKPYWVDHEWGAGAVFYSLADNFGDTGLLLLKFFILFGIFLSIFGTNQLRNNSEKPYRIVFYLLVFNAILPAFDNVIRSHAFTYLFFAYWLYLLDKVRAGNNKIIVLFPFTMLLWANLHGGFLAGLGIVGVFAVGEFLNRRNPLKYLLILALSGLATLINPYGLKYWSFIISAVSMNRPFVNEWAPLNIFGSIHQVTGFKIFVILTVLALIYMFIKRFKEINWSDVLILAVTFYMSIKHMRHVIFFSIAAGSYIYYWLYPAMRWYTFDIVSKIYALFPALLRKITKIFREVLVYSLILTFSLMSLVTLQRNIAVNHNMFPARAVKFIQINNLSGNLLVLFNWGSYALWKLYPQCRIAVDGRYEEVYTDDFIGDVARFHYVGVEWDGLLKKYHADLMLIPKEYAELLNELSKLDDWKIVYQDNMAVVFVPKSMNKKVWHFPSSNFDASKEKYMSDIIVPAEMNK